MTIKALPQPFSVCQVEAFPPADQLGAYCFLAQTDTEHSLVCPTEMVPEHTVRREDGWRAMRIEGVLDFSLIGILAKIITLLAQNQIGIFAISTDNTDYILTKAVQYDKALRVLGEAGYEIA